MERKWYEMLDEETKKHFERLVLASYLHKHAFEKAERPAIAQLWIALAMLSKKNEELTKKINEITQQISRKKQAKKKASKTRAKKAKIKAKKK